VWWGVELVVRGRGVKTHVDRFRGSYKNLGIADHLVLDCRTEPLKAAADHDTSKVATISPHVAEGWNVIVLDYHGRRVYVPRDTVPRYVEDWSVADPVVHVARRLLPDRPPTFYCRVELPDETTVSTDVAATLRKDDLPRTVDGLKKALKKKLADELHGIGISRLTVYPPGKERGEEAYGSGATVGDVDTAVVAASLSAPYHVVVT